MERILFEPFVCQSHRLVPSVCLISLMTVAYATWAFVPDSILHPLGISYYPDRYWTYAAPLYIFLAWVFSIIVYFAYNFINTAPIDSYYIITGILPPNSLIL